MKTEDLIRKLGQEATPIRRHALQRRLAIGLAVGVAVAMALVEALYGVRHDLGSAIATTPFLIKAGFTLSLAIGAFFASLHLARPESRPTRWFWLIALPFLLIGATAAAEIAAAPRKDWASMIMGQSAPECLMRIALISIPLLAGLAWSFRRFAPADLRAAGAALGGVSGAIAAFLYALHCTESATVFIALWYSLGVIVTTLAGALLGPRLLRW